MLFSIFAVMNMRPQWLTVLGCLCLAGTAYPAVVPTPDTMVVTRSDETDVVSLHFSYPYPTKWDRYNMFIIML
jgi:hypothetical protein